MVHSKEIGNLGEELAVEHLMKNGYEIVERNWASGRGVHCTGEIDIIARKGEVLAFVEVKCRKNGAKDGSDFSPEAAFNATKIKRMQSAVNNYLVEKNYLGDISVVLVAINILKDGEQMVRMYENMRIF